MTPGQVSWSSTSTASTWINFTSSSSSIGALTIPSGATWSTVPVVSAAPRTLAEHLELAAMVPIPSSWRGQIALPDGAVVKVDAGKYQILDAAAQVTYRANRIREFNRYVNASDLLEEFIGFLGELGARQAQVLDVPIEVFINWLIMRAAQQDGEPVPDGVMVMGHPKLVPQLPAPTRWMARCRACGRFVGRKVAALAACSPAHAALAFERVMAE